MEAMRVIKTIEDTALAELSAYIGRKVEIIVCPVDNEPGEDHTAQLFALIEQCAGRIEPWTREELYER